MHVAQMVAVHSAMMRIAGELARAEYVQDRGSATRAINQLARTYTAQLEALRLGSTQIAEQVYNHNDRPPAYHCGTVTGWRSVVSANFRDVIGFANKKPCTRSKPISRTVRKSPRVSKPSATVRTP